MTAWHVKSSAMSDSFDAHLGVWDVQINKLLSKVAPQLYLTVKNFMLAGK